MSERGGSDDSTRVYGLISARGGNIGGDGGFVETSGKQGLEISSVPDVSAINGKGGEWLIDPNHIDIVVLWIDCSRYKEFRSFLFHTNSHSCSFSNSSRHVIH